MHRQESVRGLIRALLIVGLLLVGVVPASAQGVGDASRRFRESLPTGTRVRVAVRETGRAQGRVVEVSDSTLQLDGAAGALVPLMAIDSLWHWKRSWATGARRGAVAGVVAGLLFSAVYCKLDCGAAQSVGVFAGTATLGAAAGAVTGGLIGLPMRHWSRLHP